MSDTTQDILKAIEEFLLDLGENALVHWKVAQVTPLGQHLSMIEDKAVVNKTEDVTSSEPVTPTDVDHDPAIAADANVANERAVEEGVAKPAEPDEHSKNAADANRPNEKAAESAS